MYQGFEDRFGELGTIIQKIWQYNVIQAMRVSSRIMYVKLCIGKCVVTILSIYARNKDRECILEFADDNELAICNCLTTKNRPCPKIKGMENLGTDKSTKMFNFIFKQLS